MTALCHGTAAVLQGDLQAVLDALPFRIFWKNGHSAYLGCNRAFAADAGMESPRAIVGKYDHEMFWADQADRYRADDRLVMTSGRSRIDAETIRPTPDGRKIRVRITKVALFDDEGCVIGVLGAYENITDRKKAEEESLRACFGTMNSRNSQWSLDKWSRLRQGRVASDHPTLEAQYGTTSI